VKEVTGTYTLRGRGETYELPGTLLTRWDELIVVGLAYHASTLLLSSMLSKI
jgi:hypothetical protein